MRHHFYHCVQYELLIENYCKNLLVFLVVKLLIYCKNHLAEWNLVIYLQIRSYTSPIGLDIAFTNVKVTLK